MHKKTDIQQQIILHIALFCKWKRAKELSEGGTTYYQVAATVLDKNTLHRELASLNRIPAHHQKFLNKSPQYVDNVEYEMCIDFALPVAI